MITQKIIDSGSFCLQDNLMEQKDIRLKDYPTVIDALRAGQDIDGDEIVIMLSRRGKLYELNLIGSIIWECLKAHKETKEIAEDIAEAFDIDTAKTTEDILLFIEDLEKEGFLILK